MSKVFLGGTCNSSTWREQLIPLLKIDYFNPVVENWTPECQDEELRQREICDYLLYVITPKMKGAYSIAEAVDDSNKRPEKTIFCVLLNDEGKEFSTSEFNSLVMVKRMVKGNGAYVMIDLIDVAAFLNARG